VVANAGKNNGDGSKPASPATMVGMVGESESDKVEVKDGLPRREDLDASDDVVGDNGDGARYNSKPIKCLLDGDDIQVDVVKDDAPTPTATDGGGSKGKGKRIVPEGEHMLYYWTEREWRKKTKNLYNTLHSLLPQLPQKVSIYLCRGLHIVQP
jgi:hypothetical protein